MLEISRHVIRQFRSVCRRAGIKPRAGRDPVVQVEAGAEGLGLVAGEGDVVIGLRQLGHYEPFQAAVPLALFGECESRKDDTVKFSVVGQHVTLSWQEHRIPQQRSVAMLPDQPAVRLPEPASATTTHAPILLSALADASATADPNAGRYALGHLQLRGAAGRIAATDGRQLLLQSGYAFPWAGDLLVPACSVYGAPELRAAKAVEVGKAEGWLILRAGAWTIAVRIHAEGRYPSIERVLPSGDPVATVALPAVDAEFLCAALPRLPGAGDHNQPVTVDLNGQACVRATDAAQPAPTELVLTNAQLAGVPTVLEINRRLLARALSLGFRTLKVYDSSAPVLFADGNRQYIVMPLTSDKPLRATPDTVRIASPSLGGGRTTTSTSGTTISMSNSPTPAEAAPAPSSAATAPVEPKRAKKPAPSALEQALAVRAALRETATRANELVLALKREQRQQRIVKDTLRSLKQLQAA